MLDIIKSNPFRTLGVYANATSSAIAGRSMQLQAKLRSDMTAETPESLDALCGDTGRSSESISIARSALQRPADRLEHALFWFTAADAIDTAALDAIGKGNIRLAEDIWKGSPESVSARHNLALLLLATERTAEAHEAATSLFADKPREICSLLAPGLSVSSTELSTIYRRLAPAAAPAVREASSAVIEPSPVRPKPKPRPAVSIKTEPAARPATISPVGKRPAPPIVPSFREEAKPEAIRPPAIDVAQAEAAPAPAPNSEINDTLEYMNSCIRRLTAEQPTIEGCTRFFDDTDIGMSRLRNSLERKDPAAYRSWSDGCARHLMAALSRLGKYRKGEMKTARAMTLLSKCKSWGLSPDTEKEVNDYIARLYAAKRDDSTTAMIIVGVFILLFLMQTCN